MGGSEKQKNLDAEGDSIKHFLLVSANAGELFDFVYDFKSK